MGSETGLRERKKQRTREAIVEAAMRLFDERGFDGTTITDIAAEADIAPRTFFGYFPTKEDVVFSDVDADYEELRAALGARAADQTAIAALRGWIDRRVEAKLLSSPELTCRRRLIAESESLAAYDAHVKDRFRDLLAAAVARDLGEPADALRPRMVAAAAIAALEAIVPKDAPDGEHDPAAAIAVLDQATTFLDGGLAALRGGR